MNNDLISRSVLKDIWELYQKYQPKLATNVYEFGEALKGIIDNASTVEAVEFEYHSKLIKQAYQKGKDIRPQGEWVGDTDYESYQGHYEAYKCSNCGYGLHWRDYYSNKYNYCPNCGADMRKGGAE